VTDRRYRLSPRAAAWSWWGGGVALLALCVAVACLAREFAYGTDMGSRPILLFVTLASGAGFLYLGVLSLIHQTSPSRGLAWWVFFAGAAMRLVMAISQPILEDDWYRYLWDGAVSAHAINPYTVIPRTALEHLEAVDARTSALAQQAGVVLERVNHPELGTIYPPVTQAVFAVAHWIAPWQLGGLRVLYFITDCLSFALLLRLLGRLGRSPLYVSIYWWNPLLVKECYNGLHMDILAVPLVLGALLLLFRNRSTIAAGVLAGAVAVKLWPVLLLPPLLATQWQSPRRMIAAGITFVAVAAILLAPMSVLIHLNGNSGLMAYGQRWEMNDALFMVFPWAVSNAASLVELNLSITVVHRLSRIIAASIVVATSLYVALLIARRRPSQIAHGPGRERENNLRSAHGWCAIVAVLFLISPTQFPWYFVWILPLLTLVPRASLLLLTAVLPLYYLKFYLDARGEIEFFHYRVVWLEFLPVWGLLAYEWYRERYGARTHGETYPMG